MEIMRFTYSLPETPCGVGSTLKNTKNLRMQLRPFLDKIGVKSMVDAPCGDFNWMRYVDLTGIKYIGLDNSPENIGIARRNAPEKEFCESDITSERLPKADAVFCRDFFQHIPTALVHKAIDNMKGSKLLIATSHKVEANKDLPAGKRFRFLNLEIEPFNLGEPVDFIIDWPGRILGVWKI